MKNSTPKYPSDVSQTSRRRFLQTGVAVGGVLGACTPSTLQDPARNLGEAPSTYGQRSPFEKSSRIVQASSSGGSRRSPGGTPEAGLSRTPLQDSRGILTPSSLHFERHHAGTPEIDPARHRLLIHGLVERPLIFTMEELRQLPSVSRILFVECSGNSQSEWSTPGSTVQRSHGTASCSEWTGVELSLLLKEVGIRPEGKWIVAEGADACKMHRSLPVEKAMKDMIVAYGQNGEAVRPGQGYPLRLVIPGWEGNTHIKWLRRIKVVDQPYMGREETSKYTDLLPDGTARQFTFTMEAKSVITYPSGGHRLPAPGRYEITGLAWSGRGLIDRVEISTDEGQSWQEAELQEPRLPICFTRFRFPWQWEGQSVTLQSRCTDETGYLQPSREELIEVRGLKTFYHFNGIKVWQVLADGSVQSVPA